MCFKDKIFILKISYYLHSTILLNLNKLSQKSNMNIIAPTAAVARSETRTISVWRVAGRAGKTTFAATKKSLQYKNLFCLVLPLRKICNLWKYLSLVEHR